VVDVLIHPFREPLSLDATSLASGAIISVVRVACGFALAALTAVPIGLLVGRWRPAREVLAPTIAAAMVISPIAWMPIAIIVFGLSSPATAVWGDEAWRFGLLDQLRFAIVAVIWLGSFFPIVLNTAAGAGGVRDAHLEAARVLGASRRQLLTKVVLPSAGPSIMTGLRVGGGIAWRVIIVAEIFPGTRGGLGYMITTAHEQASYEYAFASIIVIAAIGLGIDGLLRLAARRVGRWQVKQR
jgi:NitT/TauT family transport system permease protein